MPKEARIIGVDASLQHGALTLLVDGKLKDLAYYTSIVGSAKMSKRGELLKIKEGKPPDKQRSQMARLAWLHEFYTRAFDRMKPTHIILEDYAVGMARGAHYIGEIGGVLRLMMFNLGVSFRLHDPTSLKMYACLDGSAEKHEMEAAVLKRWGKDFGRYNGPVAKNGTQNRTTSEDLTDAFALAQLGWLEVQLRDGRVQPRDLHPKELQTFNRVTKSYSISLLGREWLKK
jgi:Holliday junction resolvasome RuvABC endonuclease subunit